MAGFTEDRFDALEARIAALEARRGDQVLLIENERRCDQDTTEAERVLQQIEEELAALRVRTATFASDPRHS
jgi:hypothetical protein